MSAIFISHSSQDNAVAEEIRLWLAEHGHRSVFLDFDPAQGIPAGRDWEQELYRGIRSCRAVIILCSKHSMASRWCFMEITHARALGKHLFPVRIDDCDIDGVLTDHQVVDLTLNRGEALERLWNGILASGLDPADAFDWDNSRPAYPGLLAFQEEDAAIFFGRDDEIGEGLDLVNKVRRLGQTKLVMVLGASGTGKSSLVRAGLLPRLRRDRERWLVVDPFRPRDDPARELSLALSRTFDRLGQARPWERIYEQLREAMERVYRDAESSPNPSDPEKEAQKEAERQRLLQQISTLEEAFPEETRLQAARGLQLVRAALEHSESQNKSASEDYFLSMQASDLLRRNGRDDARLLLLIDQFEELLGHDPDHLASRFLRLLRNSLDRPGSPLIALGTMRSDFLGLFQKNPALLDVRYESLSLGPMSSEDVGQVIEKPAQLATIDLEPGLVQALVADAETEDALPLLAFTLRELNEKYGKDGLLEVREYRDLLGGLQGAVAKAADEILEAEQVSERQEKELRKAFLAMVRITDEGNYARRAAHWEDFPVGTHPLLEKFVQGRLLVAGSDDQGRTLEVAHEALFRSWDRLVQWLDESAEALRLHHEIQMASRAWESGHRTEDDLWRGGRLARARELIENGDLPLQAIELTFVRASHDAEQAQIQAEEKRRRRNFRIALASAVGGITLALIAGISAYRANEATARATEQSRIATSRQLAAQVPTEREKGLDLALLLSVQAQRFSSTTEAQRSLLASLQYNPPLEKFFTRFKDRVNRAVFSPDGNLIATASVDGLGLWNADDGSEIAQLTSLPVKSIAFSPDGGILAAGSGSGDIMLWNVTEKSELAPLPGHHDDVFTDVNDIAFSSDGAIMASASSDKTIKLWNVADRDTIATLTEHEGPVFSVAFSPDGRTLASGSSDNTIRLWNVADRDTIATLTGNQGPVNSVAFSSDGSVLASGSSSGALTLWNVAERRELALLTGHEAKVNSVTFSPNGDILASASGSLPPADISIHHRDDNSIKLWSIAEKKEIARLTGHQGPIFSVAFSPDGNTLVSSSNDATVMLWSLVDETNTTVLSGHQSPVRSIAFSPDDSTLVSASQDHAIILWDIDERKEIDTLQERQEIALNWINSVAFSPDGSILASAALDGIVRLWSLAEGSEIAQLKGHQGSVNSIAFSPEGNTLASASQDSSIRLWSISQKKEVAQLRGHQAVVNSVAYSPDGRFLASASQDSSIRLWSYSQKKEVALLKGHQASVSSVAFSPDGDILASISGSLWQRDYSITLWNVVERREIASLTGHTSWVNKIAFSPDGQILASASSDSTIRLWHVAERKEIAQLPGETYVNSVAFSPDGNTLASAFGNGDIKLWNMDWPGRACQIANRNLTRDEWNQFLMEIPYQCTCPDKPPGEGTGLDACPASVASISF